MKINVYISRQQLELLDDTGNVLRRYAMSSSEKGVGELSGSFRTPRGKHIIRAKIGAGQPENTVFVRRRPTGEIYTPELGAQFPDRDWMLTRILWLSGLRTRASTGWEHAIPCAAISTSTARRIQCRSAYPVRMAASGCTMPI